jgi:hypothetical protein
VELTRVELGEPANVKDEPGSENIELIVEQPADKKLK